jgi:hypothetical protein
MHRIRIPDGNRNNRFAVCHYRRKTIRVLRNPDHAGCHSAEWDLYDHVKTEKRTPLFYGAKLLIHSIADKRLRSGADLDQPHHSGILEEEGIRDP